MLLVVTQGLTDSQWHHCMYHTLRITFNGFYGALDLGLVESVLHFLSSNELILFRLLAIVLFLYLPISFGS